MPIDRSTLYRLPWSRADNAGGWIEVTDACDFSCPACYRHRLTGHRKLEELKAEVLALRRATNCDRIAIAGGEPLLYPRIVDVVRVIADQGLKPALLTNGERLTLQLARELQRAGLAMFHFHVDSGMRRPGWEGRNEAEMNELRQRYADLVWQLDGVQCAFNITVFRSTARYLPDILDWARRNLHKVQHVSLITFRSIPLVEGLEFRVHGEPVDVSRLQHVTTDPEELTLTAEEMYETLRRHDPGYRACTYLAGTSAPATYKFLVTIQVGTVGELYGYLGARTVEYVQAAHHLVKGRYCAFLRDPRVGHKVLLMALVDRSVRGIARRFWRTALRSPRRAFDPMYAQTISLQQPNEMLGGQANLCDGCLNMMLYGDELIPSCRLDEYRIFGGPLTPAWTPAAERGHTAPPGASGGAR